MDRKRFDFGFRYEEQLEERVVQFCKIRRISLNTLVERAFNFTSSEHDKGKIFVNLSSGFIFRPSCEDKVEKVLKIEALFRERVRNFAFSYRLSMAEVLRIALEVYLDYHDTQGGKLGKVKHYYSRVKSFIKGTIFFISPAFSGSPIPYYIRSD